MRAHNNWSRLTEYVDDVVPRNERTSGSLSALTWLFNNEKELVYPEPCLELHHRSLQISFANPDFTIDISMEEQECNQVCTTTRTSGFAGIDFLPEELKKLQKKGIQILD